MANNGMEQLWQKISPIRGVKERQWWEKETGKAEELISNIAGVGSKISGDYKGEGALGVGKFLSGIFGGPLAVPLNMLLSGIDLMAEKKYAKKITKEVEDLKPTGKGPQAEYEREQYDLILEQVNQAARGTGMASLMSNLMDVGVALDVPGKMMKKAKGLFAEKPWIKSFLEKKMPGPTYLSEFKPGEKLLKDIKNPFLPKEKIGVPTGYDWFSLLSPYYNKAIRGKPEISVRQAPGRRRGY